MKTKAETLKTLRSYIDANKPRRLYIRVGDRETQKHYTEINGVIYCLRIFAIRYSKTWWKYGYVFYSVTLSGDPLLTYTTRETLQMLEE